jgi:uncharacterized repeat protein (TIGR01451 family)
MYDTLPSKTTFVSCAATGGGVCKGSGLKRHVRFNNIGSGASVTVTLVATVKSGTAGGTVLVDRAWAKAATTPDPNMSNNSASVSVTVASANADLSVSLAASPDTVPAGGNVTYTMIVSNLGPGAASSVLLTNNLPASTTFVSCGSTGSGVCGGSGNARQVSFSSLASGASETVTMVTQVNASTPDGTVLADTAKVQSSTSDPAAANNSATAQVTVGGPGPQAPVADLGLSIDATPDSVLPDSPVTYEITLTNAGPDAAFARLLDNLPAGTTFVSCSSPSGTCDGSGNSRTISFPSVASGGSATATLVATVNSGVPAGTVLADTVSVDSSDATDPNPANDSASANVTVLGVPGADLSLSLTATPDPVFVDSSLTYTIKLKNNGPLAASSVVVSDSLPPKVAFVSCASTGGGACAGAGNARSISYATLAPGDSAKITLVTTVDSELADGTAITNRAAVSAATPDPSAANDSAAVSVIAKRSQPPDIILILTDDQPNYIQSYMPVTNALIGDQGVRFNNYFVSTPICGASRANLFSGQYSHHTGVYGNGNAATRFDDSSSIATWLDAAGYKTALVGKYLNNYNEIAPYVAQGWDEWRVFVNTLYYDYDLVENGTIVHYGNTNADYSTNVLADHAVSIIQQTPANQPLFLEVATWGPHSPATPANQDEGDFAGLAPYQPPSFNEADVSDKPLWVRNLPLVTPSQEQGFNDFHEDQVESLQSIDRAVGDIINALAAAGRLQKAVLIFTSDNGWSLGAHRWEKKLCPYEECAHVPLLIRAPGLTPHSEPALASNIDLAPTIAEFAGVQPGLPVNGQSLVPLLNNPATPWRDALLLENLSGAEANMNYSAVRDDRYLYSEYTNGDRELYDLLNDPFQLDNAVNNPAYASVVASLQVKLQQLKSE